MVLPVAMVIIIVFLFVAMRLVRLCAPEKIPHGRSLDVSPFRFLGVTLSEAFDGPAQ